MVPDKPIKQIVESSDDDREEIYPKLSQFCENHSKLKIEFKFNPGDSCYYLQGDFSISSKIFESLFDH
jgi:hypothetical protein